MREWLKKYIIPNLLLKVVRPYYHGVLAFLASFYYRRPLRELIVIGVTGTAGKSTTAQMLARIFNQSKKKCGFITTISFFDGETEYINKHGLSMPGGWLLHRQLKQMADKDCQYAVIECTSEGLAQNRHLGIGFGMAAFTNISPAHIEAHGGFDAYRKAKGKLFKSLVKSPPFAKASVGKHKSLAKPAIIVNLDDEQAGYFLGFKAERKIGASFESKTDRVCDQIYQAHRTEQGFELNGVKFEVKLIGKFNHYNALLATVAANGLGVSLEDCARVLSSFTKIRGRMEPVENNRRISVFVDYGCEPASIAAALKAAITLSHNRIIHVFGSTGGHRDKQKRFEFGKISARYSDEIIITNDDVYDSDPEEIVKDIESGIRNQELWRGNYQIILDRRAAIRKALGVAQAGDIVLITGKGSEQFLVLPENKRIEWDEVSVVEEELKKIPNH